MIFRDLLRDLKKINWKKHKCLIKYFFSSPIRWMDQILCRCSDRVCCKSPWCCMYQLSVGNSETHCEQWPIPHQSPIPLDTLHIELNIRHKRWKIKVRYLWISRKIILVLSLLTIFTSYESWLLTCSILNLVAWCLY